MKKYGILFIILLSNCAEPPDLIPEKFYSSGYNFSKYSEKGFLFTPNQYQGDYESVGLVQLTYTPEAKIIENFITGPTGKKVKKKSWIIDKIKPDKAIEEIYNVCITMGADALTQMVIEPYSENHAQGTSKPITLTGIKISGFAVKRLGAFD